MQMRENIYPGFSHHLWPWLTLHNSSCDFISYSFSGTSGLNLAVTLSTSFNTASNVTIKSCTSRLRRATSALCLRSSIKLPTEFQRSEKLLSDCSRDTGMLPWFRQCSINSSPFFCTAVTLGLRCLLALSSDWGERGKKGIIAKLGGQHYSHVSVDTFISLKSPYIVGRQHLPSLKSLSPTSLRASRISVSNDC